MAPCLSGSSGLLGALTVSADRMRARGVACLGMANFALLALSCADGGVSAEAARDGATAGSPGPGVGVTGGVVPADPGAGEPELPPEQELEQDFRVPVSTGRFVWT